ncbi:NADH pyrophosphatase [Candidatus Entotheonellaceae bacterium PAL068K]
MSRHGGKHALKFLAAGGLGETIGCIEFYLRPKEGPVRSKGTSYMDREHYHHHHHHATGLQFCSTCGGRLARQRVKAHEPERLVCTACGFIVFEDPKVTTGTIPLLDDKIVLLKRGIEPSYGRWSFPGGFMDRGERVEDAAVRETWEEANIKVDITRLLNVYSYPGHPVVVIVYLAEVVGGELQAMDETLEARLFAPPDIPWDELAFPSTRESLQDCLGIMGAAGR